MIKLTKKADYAIVLMSYLHSHADHYTSIRLASEETGIPYKFASQIATELKKANLVNSKEGVDGGYTLAKPADTISVLDIIEAIEGPLAPTTCIKQKDCQCQPSCHHQQLITTLTQQLRTTLKNQTLAMLQWYAQNQEFISQCRQYSHHQQSISEHKAKRNPRHYGTKWLR